MTDVPPLPPPAGDGPPEPPAPDLLPPPAGGLLPPVTGPPPLSGPASTDTGPRPGGMLLPPPAATSSGPGPASLPASPTSDGSRRGGRGPLIAILAVVAAVVIAIIVVIAVVAGGGDDEELSIPDPTEEPDGLGDDAAFDRLAEDCYDGEMGACDDLYRQSDAGSAYQRYGDTCAGRQPERTRDFCTTAFPD